MTKMNSLSSVTRRAVIATGAAAGGGLAVGFHLPGREASAQTLAGATAMPGELNAWLVIGKDDSVTIRVHRSEMGQGSSTAIPQLVAEELQCDWAKVRM